MNIPAILWSAAHHPKNKSLRDWPKWKLKDLKIFMNVYDASNGFPNEKSYQEICFKFTWLEFPCELWSYKGSKDYSELIFGGVRVPIAEQNTQHLNEKIRIPVEKALLRLKVNFPKEKII